MRTQPNTQTECLNVLFFGRVFDTSVVPQALRSDEPRFRTFPYPDHNLFPGGTIS